MGEDEQDRILTVPAELDGSEPVLPTANEWVALPDMGPATGAVRSATLLHEAAAGLVAFRGTPLSRPHCEVDGTPVAEGGWAHDLLAAHIPRHTATAGGCDLTLTTFCPPDHKGFVQVLEAVNSGPHAATVDLALEGRFVDTDLHVFTPRAVSGPQRCAWDDWTRALVWEASAGLPIGALAVRALDGAPPGTEPDPPPVAGPELAWSHRHRGRCSPASAPSWCCAGAWGARRTAPGSRRSTSPARAGVRCSRRPAAAAGPLGPPLPDRPELEDVRNRNRLFCLAFAAGRTIDTERLVLVTSRSPRYYVSAAHWSRDSLLWAFPSVLAADLELAADWLRAAFHLYTRNVGRHALYLDGVVLYDGFELDQVAAFHLALDAFLEAGGDVRLLEEPAVRSRAASRRRRPGAGP
jgi:uncharacterized protein